MKVELQSVTGLADACIALKMSKRSYTDEYGEKIRKSVYKYTDYMGKFISLDEIPKADRNFLVGELEKVAKWGAGVGVSSAYDAGHETILRFIDFTVYINGLHRGAMDDLDSHAKRMENRIVRSSTRGGDSYSADEISDWYKGKIIPLHQVYEPKHQNIDSIAKDMDIYIYTQDGYIRADLLENGDVQRGLYRLCIPMDCTFKINLCEIRHVYMRRNEYTKAAPELAMAIESLADQIEAALPMTIGKLVRNDYCSDGQLHHIMTIEKTFSEERLHGLHSSKHDCEAIYTDSNALQKTMFGYIGE